MQGELLNDRHLLRHPARQVNQSRLPANHAANRPHDHGQHAVRSRDGNQLAFGIDGDRGAQIGLEVAAFAEVVGLASGTDFREADLGARIDQAGEKM